MTGKLRHLAAFLMQPHPAPPVLNVKIRNVHPDRPTDPRERIAHQGDERPVAQPNQGAGVDRHEQVAHLGGIEHGGFAFLDAVLWPAHGMRRVHRVSRCT